MRTNAVILCGRQSKRVVDRIHELLEYLDADLFVIADSEKKNLFPISDRCKLVKYISDEYNFPVNFQLISPYEQHLNNQFLKIKEGFNLMVEYEKIRNNEYKVVFRIRGDILFEIDYTQDSTLNYIKSNYVYMNSDFLFYGHRNTVKYCFLLSDDYAEFYIHTLWDQENLNLDTLLETVENNPTECFCKGEPTSTSEVALQSFKDCKYLNKLVAIPIPKIDDTEFIFTKEYIIHMCKYFLSKNIKTYVPADHSFVMKAWNIADTTPMHFCTELIILKNLIRNHIVPCQCSHIKIISKLN